MSEPTVPDQAAKAENHNAFVRWKHTWSGRLAWLVLDLVIAYAFASLAIDSGAIWQYGLALFFLADGVYNFVQFLRKIFHGNKATKA